MSSDISSLLKKWNGELLIQHYDKESASWILIAIHSTIMGPATGGTRLMHYKHAQAAVNDVMKLSAGMTLKFAAMNFPRGGGKAVIMPTRFLSSEKRKKLMKNYGLLLQQLNGLFYTGPDVGTSSADMDIIGEIAPKYVFSRSQQHGGAGSSSIPTAIGVYHAIKKTSLFIWDTQQLNNKRILVQGIGGVGKALLPLLLSDGAKVYIADTNNDVLLKAIQKYPVTAVNSENVNSFDCDIFSPCALGGTLSPKTISQMKCKAVVGAANNQLSSQAALYSFQKKSILYAPDFVVNSGGAVAITGVEAMGWNENEVKIALDNIGNTVFNVFNIARQNNITSEQAARELAKTNLETFKK